MLTVENDGTASLLQENLDGYYYIDSTSQPITYNGAQVSDYVGYTYVGVEPNGSGGYDLILLHDDTDVYNIWSVNSNGVAGVFTALSPSALLALEESWDQDIDGDGDVG